MIGRVQKRGKFWCFVVDLPRGVDGKRRQKRQSGYNTKKEAEAALAAMIDRINRGDYIEPTTETVKDYLERWLRDSVQNKARQTTVGNYRFLLEKHVIPVIGGIVLSKLQPMHIQSLYRLKLESGRIDRSGGLSPTTVRRIHAVLHKAFATAVKWQLLPRNPADAVEVPKPARTQMKYYNKSQVEKLLATVEDDAFYHTLYLTAIMTGLRRGELLALRWQDINLESASASICRSLVQLSDGSLAFQFPKTEHGERNIALPQVVVIAFMQHREYQNKRKSDMGDSYQDQNLVFADELGNPIVPSTLLRHFKKSLANAKLPHIRFHDLRHTHATLMLAQGVHPKVVSERLGHGSIQITLDIYSHALPNLQAEAAKKLEQALFGDKIANDDKSEDENPDSVHELPERYGTDEIGHCVINLNSN